MSSRIFLLTMKRLEQRFDQLLGVVVEDDVALAGFGDFAGEGGELVGDAAGAGEDAHYFLHINKIGKFVEAAPAAAQNDAGVTGSRGDDIAVFHAGLAVGGEGIVQWYECQLSVDSVVIVRCDLLQFFQVAFGGETPDFHAAAGGFLGGDIGQAGTATGDNNDRVGVVADYPADFSRLWHNRRHVAGAGAKDTDFVLHSYCYSTTGSAKSPYGVKLHSGR